MIGAPRIGGPEPASNNHLEPNHRKMSALSRMSPESTAGNTGREPALPGGGPNSEVSVLELTRRSSATPQDLAQFFDGEILTRVNRTDPGPVGLVDENMRAKFV